MNKSAVYTRTGDTGMTSLVDGTRQKKNSPRIEAYGTVDELNSFVGALIASQPLSDSDRVTLTSVQNALFDIGSYLAAGSEEMSRRLLPPLDGPLKLLEDEIDRIDARLPRHNRFVLPQGVASCCAAHVCRSVARRAERRILDFADTVEGIDSGVIRYVNRLSDYFFVLARHCNQMAGADEIFWKFSRARTGD